MKTFIAILLVLAALISGVLWAARRRPSAPPMENPLSAFTTEPADKGILLQYQEGRVPLRLIRWITSRAGIQIAQVVTQSNRQQIAWFDHGQLQAVFLVPKPLGVRDGFFGFAELQDACIVPGDVAILLYRAADVSSDEQPLILALDLTTQEVRWIHRARGNRLVRTPDSQDAAVYLYGSRDPIVRLPLAAQKTDQINRSGLRSAAKIIELPSEVQEVGDLLPIGGWTFLLAHREGLATYLGVKGWTHQPLPELPSAPFKDAEPRLARGKHLWWQPQPGMLVQLHGDGTQKQIWQLQDTVTPDPSDRDGALLQLLGTDDLGRLWFSLATPAPVEPALPEAQPPEAGASEESRTDSSPPQSAPLLKPDRLYALDPTDRMLKQLAWKDVLAGFHSPDKIPLPGSLPEWRPEDMGLIIPKGPAAWWIPLEALPLDHPTLVPKPD